MSDEYIRNADAIEMCNNSSRGQLMRLVSPADVIDEVRKEIKRIHGLLSADVVWVRHGEWVKEHWHGETTRMCSVCHITQTVNVYNGEVKFNYCPYCGAKMDKE